MKKRMYRAVNELKEVCGDQNVPKFKQAFGLEGVSFDQFWSALDLLEDTAEALDAYFEVLAEDASLGRHYLGLFGTLQCLSMQQDGIQMVYKSLRCPLNLRDYATFRRVRQIRNRVCHASDLRNDTVHSAQVLRLGLDCQNVQIVCWTDQASERVHFNPTELINSQNDLTLELVIRAAVMARDCIQRSG